MRQSSPPPETEAQAERPTASTMTGRRRLTLAIPRVLALFRGRADNITGPEASERMSLSVPRHILHSPRLGAAFKDVGPNRKPDPFALGDVTIERGARALFEFVFSGADRLSGENHWASCDEKTKA